MPSHQYPQPIGFVSIYINLMRRSLLSILPKDFLLAIPPKIVFVFGPIPSKIGSLKPLGEENDPTWYRLHVN